MKALSERWVVAGSSGLVGIKRVRCAQAAITFMKSAGKAGPRDKDGKLVIHPQALWNEEGNCPAIAEADLSVIADAKTPKQAADALDGGKDKDEAPETGSQEIQSIGRLMVGVLQQQQAMLGQLLAPEGAGRVATCTVVGCTCFVTRKELSEPPDLIPINGICPCCEHRRSLHPK